jgi:hypothetical protein
MGSSAVKTITITKPADARTQIESMGGGQFAAPSSAFANPGSQAATAGDYSKLSQKFDYSLQGLTGPDVRQMLLDQETGASAALGQVTQLSSDALRASNAAMETLANVRAGEGTPVNLGKWLPLIGVGLVVLLLARRAKR